MDQVLYGTRDGSVTRFFGDDEHVFRLAWKQLIELQEKRNAGPAIIMQHMLSGEWYVEDIREVIRVGLIGGGMAPNAALNLVRAYVEERPQDIAGEDGLLMTALVVLSAAIARVPDEPVGEQVAPVQGEPNASTIFQTEESGSEPSTESVP